MTYSQAFILAVVQGVAEFLPISSSGHLAVLQNFWRLAPPVFFDVLVHVGTLLSVLFFFRRRLLVLAAGLIKKDPVAWRYFGFLFVGSLPAAFAGLFLEDYLETIFSSLLVVSFGFLITAAFLLSTRFFSEKNSPRPLNFKNAFIIGLFQAVAICPGISRSGSTITAGLYQGLSRETAFEFSFLLSLPAIFGALLLEIVKTDLAGFAWGQGILGLLVAALIGYFSLKYLKQLLLTAKMWTWGIYAGLIGLALTALILF